MCVCVCVCVCIKHKQLKKNVIYHFFTGLDTDLVYPQGLSCTLPADKQEELIWTIKGLENAVITSHGMLLMIHVYLVQVHSDSCGQSLHICVVYLIFGD